jgi:hypothetical protein
MQQLVCNAFIENQAKEDKNKLLSFLPDKEREEILSLESPSASLCEGYDLTEHLMDWVHYSWLTPFLRTLTEQELKIFLSSLNNDHAENLKQELLFSEEIPAISLISKSFLRQKLASYLLKKESSLLPITALPPSSLNCLLDLSSGGLQHLIDFLGLHDLAVELKQIIDNIKLKKIHSFLSKEKLFFLKSLAHKKESIVFKKMELTHWNGEEESLLNLLRKRGMNRLAKALFPENKDLIWYVTHRMASKEAHLFTALHKKLEPKEAYSLLGKQIIELVSFFKTHNIAADL